MSVTGALKPKVQAQMDQTKSQIQSVTTSCTRVSAISSGFDSFAGDWTNLNGFWGDMKIDADAIAVYATLGAALLADPSSITASQQYTTAIMKACADYLQTLYKQGIKPPTLRAVARSDVHSVDAQGLAARVCESAKDSSEHRTQTRLLVNEILDRTSQQLKMQDWNAYMAGMQKAAALNATAMVVEARA